MKTLTGRTQGTASPAAWPRRTGTVQEPLDPALDVGVHRSARAAYRLSERNGPGPANRDRCPVRYALEEEPS